MKVVIYGASSGGKVALNICRHYKFEVIAFVDKDESKNGMRIDGIPVKSLNEDGKQLLKNYLVIVGTQHCDAEDYLKNYLQTNYIPFDIIETINRRYFSNSNYPCYELSEENIKNCKLVENRIKMLYLLNNYCESGIIAEVGVFKGEFSRKILEIMKPRKLYLIDLWDNICFYNEVISNFKTEIDMGIVEVIKSDSRNALKSFEDNYFDMVYLDTCHNYEVPKSELDIVKFKIKPNGIISGHDYTKFELKNFIRYGVVEAINEFCIKNRWEFMYLTMECGGYHSYALKQLRRK